jgi:hypothetical protein
MGLDGARTKTTLVTPTEDFMRSTALALIVSIAGLTPLSGQDSTSTAAEPKERTLLGKVFQGGHIAVGSASVPYQSTRSSTYDVRVAVVFRRLPEWTFAIAGGFVLDAERTGYVAPGSGTFRPELYVGSDALEIQRRWSNKRAVHPIATATVGDLTMGYRYLEYAPDGEVIVHSDHDELVPFVTLAGGLEMNLVRWMRLVGTAGYRHVRRSTVPFASRMSGPVATMLLQFGRF